MESVAEEVRKCKSERKKQRLGIRVDIMDSNHEECGSGLQGLDVAWDQAR